MSPKRKKTEDASADRTPYNIQADYKEVDVRLRKRLGSLVPEELAQRIQQKLMERLEREQSEENEDWGEAQ